MNKETAVPVGKVVGLHGVKGEIKILLFGSAEGLEWKTALIGETPYRIKSSRKHKGMLLATIEGIGRMEEAEPLVGSEVSVSRED
ncbi:MAG: 16S rRNA processing protein RimM, partial [Thermodesulfobacteriota bacterium]